MFNPLFNYEAKSLAYTCILLFVELETPFVRFLALECLH